MKMLKNGESLDDLKSTPSLLPAVKKAAPRAREPKKKANQPVMLHPTSSSTLHRRRQTSVSQPAPTSQSIEVPDDDKELGDHEFPHYVLLMPKAEPAAHHTPRSRCTRFSSKVSASAPASPRSKSARILILMEECFRNPLSLWRRRGSLNCHRLLQLLFASLAQSSE